MSEFAYLLLFCAGFAGGLIDAIAGGGGLITLPSLLAVGVPAHAAMGTNKLQSACGTSLAVWRYHRAGLMKTPALLWAVGASFLSSALGAWAVTQVSQDFLRMLIPWLLAAVAIYTAMNRRFGLSAGTQHMGHLAFGLTFGAILGAYDGFFGPGCGSFWMLCLVAIQGMELRNATGYTKAVNLASNLGALGFFLALGQVDFSAALAMIAGQLFGARIGSSMVIYRGSSFIRPVFLTVVFGMSLKLLWDAWGMKS
jgi:uncharacterized membrane protein YfcA